MYAINATRKRVGGCSKNRPMQRMSERPKLMRHANLCIIYDSSVECLRPKSLSLRGYVCPAGKAGPGQKKDFVRRLTRRLDSCKLQV